MMKWVLFGAGDEGAKLANAIVADGGQIAFFIDNDTKKVNKNILGIDIISFAEFVQKRQNYKVVIAVSKPWEREIKQQLADAGYLNVYSLADAYQEIKYKSDTNLKKYKDLYSEKRCFIIGTGPSLRIEDLELLRKNKEITFASNKIFKIFNQTKWRPNLYCVIDKLVLQQYGNEIKRVTAEHKLIAKGVLDEALGKQIDFFNLVHIPYSEGEYPLFSMQPDKYVIEGFTVTYAMIQWALYMGFNEIYLLGIDFDYGGGKGQLYKHFCKNYDKPGEVINEPKLGKCLMAYKKAKMIADEHGICIYNASRGGNLDVYERVSFDEMFR